MPGLASNVSERWPSRITGAATFDWRPTLSNTDSGRWVIAWTIAVGAACQESPVALAADPAGPTPHPIASPLITRVATHVTSAFGVRRNLTGGLTLTPVTAQSTRWLDERRGGRRGSMVGQRAGDTREHLISAPSLTSCSDLHFPG